MRIPQSLTDAGGDSELYPKPDRSNYQPNFVKTAENPQLDIGWNEGVLSDGRPYRLEAFREDGMTSLNYFFSTQGLERLTNEQAADLLECEGLLRFTTSRRRAYAMPFRDASGNDMWAVAVTVAVEHETFVDDFVELLAYAKPATRAKESELGL